MKLCESNKMRMRPFHASFYKVPQTIELFFVWANLCLSGHVPAFANVNAGFCFFARRAAFYFDEISIPSHRATPRFSSLRCGVSFRFADSRLRRRLERGCAACNSDFDLRSGQRSKCKTCAYGRGKHLERHHHHRQFARRLDPKNNARPQFSNPDRNLSGERNPHWKRRFCDQRDFSGAAWRF